MMRYGSSRRRRRGSGRFRGNAILRAAGYEQCGAGAPDPVRSRNCESSRRDFDPIRWKDPALALRSGVAIPYPCNDHRGRGTPQRSPGLKVHPQEGQAGVKFDYYPDTDSLYIELNPARARKPGATQDVVGWGDHDIVIDVDEEGVPVGIDIPSFASRIVDLTKLEAEGPIFGLVRPGDSDRRVSWAPEPSSRRLNWSIGLALSLVEVLLYFGFIDVLSGYRSKTRCDLLLGRLLVGLQVIHGYPDALVAYVVRVLGDERIESSLSQVFDLGRRGIEGHDAYLFLLACLLESCSGALPGEQVGAEDAFEVGVRSEGRGGDGRRLGRIVVAVLGSQVLYVRILLYRFLEALLSLVGGRDAGLDADHHDPALFADLLGQGLAREHASFDVVGGDLGQRDLFLLDGGVDQHHYYVLVDGALYRGDH